MKVICINDKGRPAEVPANKWITEGDEYTVIDVVICKSQPGEPVALKLAEVQPPEPYFGYDSSRFRIVQLGPADLIAEEALVHE